MTVTMHSNASNAKEFRQEVIEYFKLRLLSLMRSNATGKERKENDVLMREFKYQITFWSNVKIDEETLS